MISLLLLIGFILDDYNEFFYVGSSDTLPEPFPPEGAGAGVTFVALTVILNIPMHNTIRTTNIATLLLFIIFYLL